MRRGPGKGPRIEDAQTCGGMTADHVECEQRHPVDDGVCQRLDEKSQLAFVSLP